MESYLIALLGQNSGCLHTRRTAAGYQYRSSSQNRPNATLSLMAGLRIRGTSSRPVSLQEICALMAGHTWHNFADSILGDFSDIVRVGVKGACKRNEIHALAAHHFVCKIR